MLPLFSSSGSDDCSALKTQADRCRNQKHLAALWGTSARQAFVRRRSLDQFLLLAHSGHPRKRIQHPFRQQSGQDFLQCECPLLTQSGYQPLTRRPSFNMLISTPTMPCPELRDGHEATRVHRFFAGAAVAWPLVVSAQQPERMRRIGMIFGTAGTSDQCPLLGAKRTLTNR
jgi:hypothetical protein